MCINKICCENGVFFVNDLISENKMLFTYEEFMNHYNIRLNFIEYFSILSAIPQRLLIRVIGKLNLINNINNNNNNNKFFIYRGLHS